MCLLRSKCLITICGQMNETFFIYIFLWFKYLNSGYWKLGFWYKWRGIWRKFRYFTKQNFLNWIQYKQNWWVGDGISSFKTSFGDVCLFWKHDIVNVTWVLELNRYDLKFQLYHLLCDSTSLSLSFINL